MNLELFIPELVVAGTAVAVILLDLFIRQKGWLTGISLAGIIAAAGCAIAMWDGQPQTIFNGTLAVDNLAVFFKLLFLFISAMVILSSIDYVNKMARFHGEYHALLLTATLGTMLMAATTDLISVFISLELTALSFYALVGFLKDDKSTEASLKYILLGGVTSAVLLYGMALTFGFTGETQLAAIASSIQAMSPAGVLSSPGLLLGLVLLIAGFGFKIAAVPFHMWAPDVYEGAPTPVTLYLSVGSKVAGFAVILRVFFTAFSLPEDLGIDWGTVFAVLSAVGMTLGNVLAIQQANIKRMLAYSGIAHSGYIMVGLATVGLSGVADTIGQSSLLFYVVAFALADLATFIGVITISNSINSDLIKDYTGMGKRAPLLAAALTLGLISLIGLPPAAGFMAKFYVFSGAAANGLLWLVIIAVLNSTISAFYYLRVARLMWLGQPVEEGNLPSSMLPRLAMFIACAGILLLGLAPSLLMKLAETAARLLAG